MNESASNNSIDKIRDPENIIRESVDHIEPPTGAKERMYANIMRKAAQNAKYSQAAKIIIPVAAVILLALIGANIIPRMINSNPSVSTETHDIPGSETPPDSGDETKGDTQVINPYVPAADTQEIYDVLGITMILPEGAEEVRYYILDNRIADITFNVDDIEYNYRASRSEEDFSGYYGDLISKEKYGDAVMTVLQTDDKKCYIITWKNSNVTHILSTYPGVDPDKLKEIYEEIH